MHKESTATYSAESVLIVGGGASAILLLIHLLRQPGFSASVTVVNNRFPLGKGIAYSTQEKEHLLNVRAGRMSLFPEDPNDFILWINRTPAYHSYHGQGLSERFLPRTAFGEYLLQRLEETIHATGKKVPLVFLEDEVTDLDVENGRYLASLASGNKIIAGKVVLATGNTPPNTLPGIHLPQPDHRVSINPWDEKQMEHLHPEQDVLVLGSSLTMADTVLSLGLNNFRGKIHVLSRHGKFPVTHPAERPQGAAEPEFEPSGNLNLLYRQIKERIRDLMQNQNWQEPILEAIRPHTQLLWQQFTLEEKQRFLRHLNHRWALIRHRIPAEVARELTSLQMEGRLFVYAGRLQEVDGDSELLKVKFANSAEGKTQQLEVQRIFNCTGPEGNPEKSSRQLVKNLLKKGLIRADALKLGYDALPDGRLLNRQGEVNNSLFTLGPGLRGILWESTAIPEIRIQAVHLASQLSK